MSVKPTNVSAEKPTDIFVNFKDMLLYVLLRWRVLLVVALVLSLLAGGFSYWKDYNRYQAAQSNITEEEQEAQLDAASVARITEVLQYQRAFDNISRYNKSAPLMQINAEAVPTQDISYLITGQRAKGAAELFAKYMESESLYRKIPGLTEANPSMAGYIAELVSTYTDEDETISMGAPQNAYVILHVQVMAPTKKMCEQIAKVVRENMTELTGDVRRAVGQVSLSKVYDQYTMARNVAVRDAQISSLNNQKNYEKSLRDAEEDLTSAEKDYINRYSSKEEEQVEEQTGEKDEPKPIPAPKVSTKWMVMGFIGGILLAALWYILRYLTDGRVKSAAEMTVRYSFPVFGMVDSPRKKKQCALSRWLIRSLRGPVLPLDLVEREVALAAQRADCKSLYLTGCSLSQADEEMLDGLRAYLQTQDITLEIGESPLFDATAAERMAAADGVLLAEKIGVSRHRDIQREEDIMHLADRPVVGIVVLQ